MLLYFCLGSLLGYFWVINKTKKLNGIYFFVVRNELYRWNTLFFKRDIDGGFYVDLLIIEEDKMVNSVIGSTKPMCYT